MLSEEGLETDYLRLRAVPFTEEVGAFVRDHDRTYVVEMNLDGQMRQLLQLGYPDRATSLLSIAKVDGMPLTARWLAESLRRAEEG
jgi:2-oxoglutarate ferredoxin oxidoreductase subunit alpha